MNIQASLASNGLSNVCTDSIFRTQNCNPLLVYTIDYICGMPREMCMPNSKVLFYQITLSIFRWITWHIFQKIASIHIYHMRKFNNQRIVLHMVIASWVYNWCEKNKFENNENISPQSSELFRAAELSKKRIRATKINFVAC